MGGPVVLPWLRLELRLHYNLSLLLPPPRVMPLTWPRLRLHCIISLLLSLPWVVSLSPNGHFARINKYNESKSKGISSAPKGTGVESRGPVEDLAELAIACESTKPSQ